LNLSSENPVSKFAFKCNLYRYTPVLGYDAAKNDFLFEKRLNDRLYEAGI
jgi:hypothetical protein